MLSRTNSVKSIKQISSDGSALRKTPLSLQDFTFGPKIGKGQFSEVLKAVCVRDGTNVALKRIRIFEMNDAKARHDCLQEINLLQKLNHPNVIKYLGNFVSDENLYIVLELANGGDLSGVLAHYRRVRRLMAERVAWRYCVQLCAALHHMHQQRVMHRDIKPANVFITKTGVVKLGDLGLGRFFSSRTVAAHSLVGTPYYMSPERIREAGYNFKSDIWALGCLLYELAALHSPFYGENMNLYSLCKKIEACDYLPLPSYAYSKQYRNLVKSCIKVEPEDRPDIEYLYEISQEMYKYWARTPVSLNSTPSSSKHGINDTNYNNVEN